MEGPAPKSRAMQSSFARLNRTVRLGVKSLWVHRLRSMLTMLGMVFGVCSVIAMLAVGEGASQGAQDLIRRQGSQNVILRSVKPPEDEKPTSEGQTWMVQYGLTYDDVERIRNTIPNVEVLVPARIIRQKVWNLGNRIDCDIVATVPWYPDMRNHPVQTGRFFTETEIDRRSPVCVLGVEILDDLFPREAAIGSAIRVGTDYYQIIGVMESLGVPSENGDEEEEESATKSTVNRIYIPISVAKDRFGETLIKRSSGSQEIERVELHEVTVNISNIDDVVDTSLLIDSLLSRFHKKKDYEMVVPLELLRQSKETARLFNIVLGAIAAISLLVGGIGIMNIMLASVTERTREIGIRRALGAKRHDIILQFLVETVMLSATGGLLGVLLGIAIPTFITMATKMPTDVTFWSPVLSFFISGLVGVVFGLYPAIRAADMDPVEALRHE